MWPMFPISLECPFLFSLTIIYSFSNCKMTLIYCLPFEDKQ
jgi:hypothetical protein